jgi:aryl-alcohol dehydrogenase-like predicted oxidoreductase
MGAMLQMVDKGKIRAIGVSNFFPDQLQMCLQASDQLASDQPPYSILWREIDANDAGVLPFCREHNVAVLAYSPLAQGLLTGKYTLENRPTGRAREKNVFMQEGVYEQALKVVDVLRPIADGHGKSVAQVAINWLISQPGMTSAIVGAKRARQATDNAGAADWSLNPDEITRIDEAGRAFWKQIKDHEAIWFNRPDAKD